MISTYVGSSIYTRIISIVMQFNCSAFYNATPKGLFLHFVEENRKKCTLTNFLMFSEHNICNLITCSFIFPGTNVLFIMRNVMVCCIFSFLIFGKFNEGLLYLFLIPFVRNHLTNMGIYTIPFIYFYYFRFDKKFIFYRYEKNAFYARIKNN